MKNDDAAGIPQKSTRPLFRVLAGAIAALMLVGGVPLSVYFIFDGASVGWRMLPGFLVVGSGFASVAWRGRWFPFQL